MVRERGGDVVGAESVGCGSNILHQDLCSINDGNGTL